LTEYYKAQLEKGLDYQDFIIDLLSEVMGISLSQYASKKYQLVGETKQGIEIKYQSKMADYGNLYIETEEKSNAANRFFVRSGIYRDDNTWLWITGDYSIQYVFSKLTLVRLHKCGRYRYAEPRDYATSKGFLLPMTEADKYCLVKIADRQATITCIKEEA
jgi:hypothetical protein